MKKTELTTEKKQTQNCLKQKRKKKKVVQCKCFATMHISKSDRDEICGQINNLGNNRETEIGWKVKIVFFLHILPLAKPQRNISVQNGEESIK